MIAAIVFGYVELRLGKDWTNVVIIDLMLMGTVIFLFVSIERSRYYLMARSARLLMERRRNADNQVEGSLWKDYPVDDEMRARIEAARGNQAELLLGQIDMSGRASCEYGILPFIPPVAHAEFMPRDRYNIEIILNGDAVLLRKNYRGDRMHCIREWFYLEQMYGKASVPVVRKIDVRNAVLSMDYIFGRTLLEMLRDKGALMRDSDVKNDPAFVGVKGEERQRKLDERGKALLTSVFSEEFLQKVDMLVANVHACRISDLDIRFANIIRDNSGNPWMIDFHEVRKYPVWAESLFRFKRAGDIQNYFRTFGRSIVEKRIGAIPKKNTAARETNNFARAQASAHHGIGSLGRMQ
ncbi:MAG: hypothetical protein ABI623_02230 [bacterium]